MLNHNTAPPCSLFPLLSSSERSPLEILKEVDRGKCSFGSSDKTGLQEPDVGKQCEAIVFITKVIEKFPLPIIVNTSMLKLSSLFKNRFVRKQLV